MDNIYQIDATGKVLGRLATQIAVLLRGRNKASFVHNVDAQVTVEISNVEKIKVTGKKMDSKQYFHYSGYPGGIKAETLRVKMAKDPKFALREAVYHMLPANKMRDVLITRLKFVSK